MCLHRMSIPGPQLACGSAGQIARSQSRLQPPALLGPLLARTRLPARAAHHKRIICTSASDRSRLLLQASIRRSARVPDDQKTEPEATTPSPKTIPLIATYEYANLSIVMHHDNALLSACGGSVKTSV